MGKCLKCGTEVAPTAKFCGECGAKIERKKYCPECGTEVKPEQIFCTECGTRLIESETLAPDILLYRQLGGKILYRESNIERVHSL